MRILVILGIISLIKSQLMDFCVANLWLFCYVFLFYFAWRFIQETGKIISLENILDFPLSSIFQQETQQVGWIKMWEVNC